MKDYKYREPQISEREIERKYSKVKIEDALPNRINCYTCKSCSNITKTIDIHVGTTPFMIRCDKCGDDSYSSFYNNIHPDLKPTHEWFVPTLEQTKKYKKNQGMLEHIFMGGLELRKIEL